MKKISDALHDLVAENQFFEFGLSYRIFNLTQLAKFIQPLLEARTQKEVQPSAILMSLSRLQRTKEKVAVQPTKFRIENIFVRSNLSTITFFRDPNLLKEIRQISGKIQPVNSFFEFTQSTHEITIFFENALTELVGSMIMEKPKYENRQVACVGVSFAEELFEVPGFLGLLMQKINLQNINLIEVSSTYTEFNFYLEEKDVKLAFETLHDSFLR